jgi:N-acetylglucosaminyldiphosphoundecaprenol N-acetyl-beta-D-mannosaminyltransferase
MFVMPKPAGLYPSASKLSGGAFIRWTTQPSFATRVYRPREVNRPQLQPHARILDATVNFLTREDLNRVLCEEIEAGNKSILANHNLHSLYLYQRQPEFRKFFQNAKYVHADGMSMVLLGQLLGQPLKREHRNGYLEWLPSMLDQACAKGWKVFYLGSRPEVWEKSISILREKWPTLQIEGHHGYFDKSEGHADGARILKSIRDYSPNILLVGMGMPIQEKWMMDNFDEIETNMMLACGALMDFVAGAIPSPPVWVGRIGFEWLFRLCSEPQRLWKRYLLEPLYLLPRIGAQMLRSPAAGAKLGQAALESAGR